MMSMLAGDEDGKLANRWQGGVSVREAGSELLDITWGLDGGLGGLAARLVLGQH